MRKDGLMSAIQMLLAELNHEARATRRVLERVPGDRLHYRPHEKSNMSKSASLFASRAVRAGRSKSASMKRVIAV